MWNGAECPLCGDAFFETPKRPVQCSPRHARIACTGPQVREGFMGDDEVCAAIAEWIRPRISGQKTLLSMLLDLPVEILSEILVLLDYLSISHCSAVNLFPLPRFSVLTLPNRFAGIFVPSSQHLSISNINSSSQRMGSLMGHPEGQRPLRPRGWTSYSSDV